MTRLPPIAIEILLYAFYSPEPLPSRLAGSIAGTDWIGRLMRADLIAPTGTSGAYTATARGAAHVEQLCNLPLPQRAWVDGAGAVIGGSE